MAGVWWMIGRRMKLAEEARQSTTAADEMDKETSQPAPSPAKDEKK